MNSVIIERLLEVIIAVMGIVGIHWKFADNTTLDVKDLLKEIERQERQIELIKLRHRAWKHHHKKLKNIKKYSYLHS